MAVNVELAALLYAIADLYEVQGVRWKPQAYRRAARTIESLSTPIDVVYREQGSRGLKQIPSIGEGISKKIIEFLDTGSVEEYTRMKETAAGVEDLLKIPGLGPKRALLLQKKLGVNSVNELYEAVQAKKVRELPGFGVKSEEDILRGIQLLKQSRGRVLLGRALPLAREIIAELKKNKSVIRAEIAGSLRRRKETIGDIDILATSNEPVKTIAAFVQLPNIKTVIAKGPTKATVILKEGMNADLRVLDDDSWGSALQYFTGNKDHNIILRNISIKKGMKLSEYGLFRKEKRIAGKTEAEVYAALGLDYIEPELREKQGEIEAARGHTLPTLVQLSDIRGDLHMHTTWSDGMHTSEAMISAAQSFCYEYVGISDHSVSQHIANGLNEERCLEHIKELRALQEKFSIRVLAGAEIDILAKGNLDYGEATRQKLDYTIGSIHSRFKASQEEMTKRICTAIESGAIAILGHPTGRLINERSPYAVDMEKSIRTAQDCNVALEINAHPSRLDLSDTFIRMAVEKGAKLVINTDSHATTQLRNMELGVAQARRGWAEKADIINTYPLKELHKFFKKR